MENLLYSAGAYPFSMAVVVASAILLAAKPTPVPVRLALNDLIGMWVTVSG